MLFFNFLCLFYLMVLTRCHTISKSIANQENIDESIDGINLYQWSTGFNGRHDRRFHFDHRRDEETDKATQSSTKTHHAIQSKEKTKTNLMVNDKKKTTSSNATATSLGKKSIPMFIGTSVTPAMNFFRRLKHKFERKNKNSKVKNKNSTKKHKQKRLEVVKIADDEVNVVDRDKRYLITRVGYHDANKRFFKDYYTRTSPRAMIFFVKRENTSENTYNTERKIYTNVENLIEISDRNKIIGDMELFRSTSPLDNFSIEDFEDNSIFFRGTADIEALLDEMKSRDLKEVFEDHSLVDEIIQNSVTETTYDADTLLRTTSLSNFNAESRATPVVKSIEKPVLRLQDMSARLSDPIEINEPFSLSFLSNKDHSDHNINIDAIMKVKETLAYGLNKACDEVKSVTWKLLNPKKTTKVKKIFTSPRKKKLSTLNKQKDSTKTTKPITKQKTTTKSFKKYNKPTLSELQDDYSLLEVYENALAKSHQENVKKMLTMPTFVSRNEKNKLFKRDLSDANEDKPKLKELEPQPDSEYDNNLQNEDSTKSDQQDLDIYDEENPTTLSDSTVRQLASPDFSYNGLTAKLHYDEFVNGYKHYLNFARDLSKFDHNFSNRVCYQAHRHHKVDDIGKFILTKLPSIPSWKPIQGDREKRYIFDDSETENNDVTTKNAESWFWKHLYIHSKPKKKKVTKKNEYNLIMNEIELTSLKTDLHKPAEAEGFVIKWTETPKPLNNKKNTDEIGTLEPYLVDNLSNTISQIDYKGLSNNMSSMAKLNFSEIMSQTTSEPPNIQSYHDVSNSELKDILTSTPHTTTEDETPTISKQYIDKQATVLRNKKWYFENPRLVINKFLSKSNKIEDRSGEILVNKESNILFRSKRNKKKPYSHEGHNQGHHQSKSTDPMPLSPATENNSNKLGCIELSLIPKPPKKAEKSKCKKLFEKLKSKKTKKEKNIKSAIVKKPRKERSALKLFRNFFKVSQDPYASHDSTAPYNFEFQIADNSDSRNVDSTRKVLNSYYSILSEPETRLAKKNKVVTKSTDINSKVNTNSYLGLKKRVTTKSDLIVTPKEEHLKKTDSIPPSSKRLTPHFKYDTTVATVTNISQTPNKLRNKLNKVVISEKTEAETTSYSTNTQNPTEYPTRFITDLKQLLANDKNNPSSDLNTFFKRFDFDDGNLPLILHDSKNQKKTTQDYSYILTSKNNAKIKPYKIVLDYFGDFVNWNRDILELDKVTASSMSELNKLSTTDLKKMMDEIMIMKNHLNHYATTTYTARKLTTPPKALEILENVSDKVDKGNANPDESRKQRLVQSKDLRSLENIKYSTTENKQTEDSLRLNPLVGLDYSASEYPQLDTTIFSYDDTVDGIGTSENEQLLPGVKSYPSKKSKIIPRPEQYFMTPVPMKSNDFNKFLQDNGLDVDNITAHDSEASRFEDEWERDKHVESKLMDQKNLKNSILDKISSISKSSNYITQNRVMNKTVIPNIKVASRIQDEQDYLDDLGDTEYQEHTMSGVFNYQGNYQKVKRKNHHKGDMKKINTDPTEHTIAKYTMSEPSALNFDITIINIDDVMNVLESNTAGDEHKRMANMLGQRTLTTRQQTENYSDYRKILPDDLGFIPTILEIHQKEHENLTKQQKENLPQNKNTYALEESNNIKNIVSDSQKEQKYTLTTKQSDIPFGMEPELVEKQYNLTSTTTPDYVIEKPDTITQSKGLNNLKIFKADNKIHKSGFNNEAANNRHNDLLYVNDVEKRLTNSPINSFKVQSLTRPSVTILPTRFMTLKKVSKQKTPKSYSVGRDDNFSKSQSKLAIHPAAYVYKSSTEAFLYDKEEATIPKLSSYKLHTNFNKQPVGMMFSSQTIQYAFMFDDASKKKNNFPKGTKNRPLHTYKTGRPVLMSKTSHINHLNNGRSRKMADLNDEKYEVLDKEYRRRRKAIWNRWRTSTTTTTTTTTPVTITNSTKSDYTATLATADLLTRKWYNLFRRGKSTEEKRTVTKTEANPNNLFLIRDFDNSSSILLTTESSVKSSYMKKRAQRGTDSLDVILDNLEKKKCSLMLFEKSSFKEKTTLPVSKISFIWPAKLCKQDGKPTIDLSSAVVERPWSKTIQHYLKSGKTTKMSPANSIATFDQSIDEPYDLGIVTQWPNTVKQCELNIGVNATQNDTEDSFWTPRSLIEVKRDSFRLESKESKVPLYVITGLKPKPQNNLREIDLQTTPNPSPVAFTTKSYESNPNNKSINSKEAINDNEGFSSLETISKLESQLSKLLKFKEDINLNSSDFVANIIRTTTESVLASTLKTDAPNLNQQLQDILKNQDHQSTKTQEIVFSNVQKHNGKAFRKIGSQKPLHSYANKVVKVSYLPKPIAETYQKDAQQLKQNVKILEKPIPDLKAQVKYKQIFSDANTYMKARPKAQKIIQAGDNKHVSISGKTEETPAVRVEAKQLQAKKLTTDFPTVMNTNIATTNNTLHKDSNYVGTLKSNIFKRETSDTCNTMCTAKDVAALEVIVDLMKEPTEQTYNEFHPSTKAIQIHIDVPYYEKKREAGPSKLRKIFKAKMSAPVDIEYQVRSLDVSTNTANTGRELLSPGMYVVVKEAIHDKGYLLRPLNRKAKQDSLTSMPTVTIANTLAKVSLSLDELQSIHHQLIQLNKNDSKNVRSVDQTTKHNIKKRSDRYRRKLNWDKIQSFFSFDDKRVCNCKCYPNKTMCKACAASDAVMTELLFEFDNLAQYMSDHCTEIQTYFWMNPSGGRKLRDIVRKIDQNMNNYYKRVKGKCRGRTCQALAIEKRRLIDSMFVRKDISREIGKPLLTEFEDLALSLQKAEKNKFCCDENFRNIVQHLVNLSNICTDFKVKRSLPKQKKVYSLDNINVNIICNQNPPIDEASTLTNSSYFSTNHLLTTPVLDFYDDKIQRINLINKLKNLFVTTRKGEDSHKQIRRDKLQVKPSTTIKETRKSWNKYHNQSKDKTTSTNFNNLVVTQNNMLEKSLPLKTNLSQVNDSSAINTRSGIKDPQISLKRLTRNNDYELDTLTTNSDAFGKNMKQLIELFESLPGDQEVKYTASILPKSNLYKYFTKRTTEPLELRMLVKTDNDSLNTYLSLDTSTSAISTNNDNIQTYKNLDVVLPAYDNANTSSKSNWMHKLKNKVIVVTPLVIPGEDERKLLTNNNINGKKIENESFKDKNIDIRANKNVISEATTTNFPTLIIIQDFAAKNVDPNDSLLSKLKRYEGYLMNSKLTEIKKRENLNKSDNMNDILERNRISRVDSNANATAKNNSTESKHTLWKTIMKIIKGINDKHKGTTTTTETNKLSIVEFLQRVTKPRKTDQQSIDIMLYNSADQEPHPLVEQSQKQEEDSLKWISRFANTALYTDVETNKETTVTYPIFRYYENNISEQNFDFTTKSADVLFNSEKSFVTTPADFIASKNTLLSSVKTRTSISKKIEPIAKELKNVGKYLKSTLSFVTSKLSPISKAETTTTKSKALTVEQSSKETNTENTNSVQDTNYNEKNNISYKQENAILGQQTTSAAPDKNDKGTVEKQEDTSKAQDETTKDTTTDDQVSNTSSSDSTLTTEEKEETIENKKNKMKTRNGIYKTLQDAQRKSETVLKKLLNKNLDNEKSLKEACDPESEVCLCDISATADHVAHVQKRLTRKEFELYVRNVSCYQYKRPPPYFLVGPKKKLRRRNNQKQTRYNKYFDSSPTKKIHNWDWIRKRRSLLSVNNNNNFDDEMHEINANYYNSNENGIGINNPQVIHEIDTINDELQEMEDYEARSNSEFETLYKGTDNIYRMTKEKRVKRNAKDLKELVNGLKNLPPLQSRKNELFAMLGDNTTLDCLNRPRSRKSEVPVFWDTERSNMLAPPDVVVDGARLLLKKVRARNSGNYTCSQDGKTRTVQLTVVTLPQYAIVFIPMYSSKHGCSYDDLRSLQRLGSLMSSENSACARNTSVQIDEPICLEDKDDGSIHMRATAIVSCAQPAVRCSAQCRRDLHASYALLCAGNAPAMYGVEVLLARHGYNKTLVPSFQNNRRLIVTHTLRKKELSKHPEYHQLAANMLPGNLDIVVSCPAGYYLLQQKICAACPEDTFAARGDNTCHACTPGTTAEPGAGRCRLSVRRMRRYDWWWYPPCGYAVAACGVVCACAVCTACALVAHVTSRSSARAHAAAVSVARADSRWTWGRAVKRYSSTSAGGARREPPSPSAVILARFFRPSASSSRADSQEIKQFEQWKDRNIPPPLPPIDFDYS